MTQFAVRKLEQAGPAPLGNLIKANERHVVAEGSRLLAEIKEQGERAYQAALEQGRRDGAEQAEAERATLMTETLVATQAHLSKGEDRLVSIVGEAVARIIGQFDGAELTARVVRELLTDAKDAQTIRLRVSPGQFQQIKDRMETLKAQSGNKASIELIADTKVEDQGCLMETEVGFVSTSVDAQLERLRAALDKFPAA